MPPGKNTRKEILLTRLQQPLPREQPGGRGLDWANAVSCLLFIFALAVSAYFEPAIRVLHVFQSLIYIAVMITFSFANDVNLMIFMGDYSLS